MEMPTRTILCVLSVFISIFICIWNNVISSDVVYRGCSTRLEEEITRAILYTST